jgi:hypothetical protein
MDFSAPLVDRINVIEYYSTGSRIEIADNRT